MSEVKKHSVIIGGHRTSITLEDIFWRAFKAIAKERGQYANDLIEEIDAERADNNLSSAIRIFVLQYYMDRVPRE